MNITCNLKITLSLSYHYCIEFFVHATVKAILGRDVCIEILSDALLSKPISRYNFPALYLFKYTLNWVKLRVHAFSSVLLSFMNFKSEQEGD